MLAEASAAKPLAPVWRTVRHLLPVYTGIAQHFDLPPAPCDLSQIDENNDQDAVLRLAEWIELIDDSSQPHHLRSALQDTGSPFSDLCLQIWIQHFLSKPAKTSCDRDKIDFLLAQYLCLNLPPSLQEKKLSRGEITAVLEPVLGACDGKLPEAIADLDALMAIAERCNSLQEFEHNAIIPRGRELKFSAGDLYFSPAYLLAFTHFNAVVRGECLRLMNSDLKFIGEGLERLDRQGVHFVDCTAANWSDHEPLFELKKKWATWELASGDYSTDFYTTLIGFRASIEEALTPSVERSIGVIWDELNSIRALLVSMASQMGELTHMVSKAALAPPVTVAPAALPDVPAALPPAPEKSNGHAAVVVETIPVLATPEPQPIAPMPEPAPPAAIALATAPEVAELPVVPVMPEPQNAQAAELPVLAPQDGNGVAELPVLAPLDIPVEVVVEPPLATAPTAPPLPEPVIPAPVEMAPPVSPKTAAPPASVTPPAAATNPGTATAPPAAAAPVTPPAQAPAAAPPAAPTTSPQMAAAANLNDGVARVQKILASNGKRTASAAVSIAVSGTRVLLTPAEVAMFSDRENPCAAIVQRAVAARLFLVSALETFSKTRDKSNLAPLVAMAKSEHESLKTAVVNCKAQSRKRDEEILSATGKQLAAMLERASRLAR